MGGSDNVRVVCRFRPHNARELSEKEASQQPFTIKGNSVSAISSKTGEPLDFTFDKVFYKGATQADVFASTSDSIRDVLAGYNATVFAYGQTGAGKSHTMFGPSISGEDAGIIPRAVDQLFAHIADSDETIEFRIKCQFMEIYMENVRDLLVPPNQRTGHLKVRESVERGVWVEGLTEEYAQSEDDVYEFLRVGEKNRATASTGMNATSSRSHSLFVIVVEQRDLETDTTISGRLNLADLAGSEKVRRTGAAGSVLAEAKKINQSLSALGNCITALTTKGRSHVPFRDSKLTYLLRESLGGNAKTTLFIACSASATSFEETVSTLRFGARAKQITVEAVQNVRRGAAELERLLACAETALLRHMRFLNSCETSLTAESKNWERLIEDVGPRPAPDEYQFEAIAGDETAAESDESGEVERDEDDENKGVDANENAVANGDGETQDHARERTGSDSGSPLRSSAGMLRKSSLKHHTHNPVALSNAMAAVKDAEARVAAAEAETAAAIAIAEEAAAEIDRWRAAAVHAERRRQEERILHGDFTDSDDSDLDDEEDTAYDPGSEAVALMKKELALAVADASIPNASPAVKSMLPEDEDEANLNRKAKRRKDQAKIQQQEETLREAAAITSELALLLEATRTTIASAPQVDELDQQSNVVAPTDDGEDDEESRRKAEAVRHAAEIAALRQEIAILQRFLENRQAADKEKAKQQAEEKKKKKELVSSNGGNAHQQKATVALLRRQRKHLELECAALRQAAVEKERVARALAEELRVALSAAPPPKRGGRLVAPVVRRGTKSSKQGREDLLNRMEADERKKRKGSNPPSVAGSPHASAGHSVDTRLEFPDKCGFLKMRSGLFRKWKPIWFVLKDDTLLWFVNKLSPNPTGEIKLQNFCFIRDAPSLTKSPFSFGLQPLAGESQQSLLLIAHSDADRDAWISEIVQRMRLADEV